MTQAHRRLGWIVANVAFGMGIYLALFAGQAWAQKAVAGFVWITLFLYLVVLLSEESRAKFFRKPQPVPPIVERICDVVFTSAFVSAGWYVTALAYVLSCVVLAATYGDISPMYTEMMTTDQQSNGRGKLLSSRKVLIYFLGLFGIVASGYIETQHSEERIVRIEEAEYKNSILKAHKRFSPDTRWARRLRASEDDPMSSLFAGGSLGNLRKEWVTGRPIMFAGFVQTLETSGYGMATRSFRIRARHSLLGQLSAPILSEVRVETICPETAISKSIRESTSKGDSYGAVLTLNVRNVRWEVIEWNDETGSARAPLAIGDCLHATIVSDMDLIGILDPDDGIPTRYSITAFTLLLLSGVGVLLGLIDRRAFRTG